MLAWLWTRLSEGGARVSISGRALGRFPASEVERLLRAQVLLEERRSDTWSVCAECDCGLDARPVEQLGDAFRACCPHDQAEDVILQKDDLRRFSVTNPMGLVSSFNQAAKVRAVFTRQIALDSIKEATFKAELEQLPDAADVQNRLLSRLVQLVKVHRNVSFPPPEGESESFAPKSVFITALIAAAYEMRAPVPHESQLDLMLDVVQHMPTYLGVVPGYGSK